MKFSKKEGKLIIRKLQQAYISQKCVDMQISEILYQKIDKNTIILYFQDSNKLKEIDGDQFKSLITTSHNIDINQQLYISIKQGAIRVVSQNEQHYKNSITINSYQFYFPDQGQQWYQQDCICELKYNSKDLSIHFMDLLSDYKVGFVPLTYQGLNNHIKRRQLKQYHLWFLLNKVSENNKCLIACSLFTNYIYKQSKDLNNDLYEIIMGIQQFIYVFDRIKCIQEIKCSQIDQQYILSNEIVNDMIYYALSSSQTLINCIEYKFNVYCNRKVKDSYYLLSLNYLNDYHIFNKKETQTIQVIPEQLQFYLLLYQAQKKTKIELFYPPQFYIDGYSKLFIPHHTEIESLLKQDPNKYSIQLTLLLMILNQEIYPIQAQCKNTQKLLYYLLVAYVKELQTQENFYEQIYLYSKFLLQSLEIQHPITKFCLHRQSVFLNQNEGQQRHSIFQHYLFQDSSLVIPCNDIRMHDKYRGKDLLQVLKASIYGFQMKEWLLMRFYELEEFEIDEQQTQYQYHAGQILMMGSNQHYQLAQQLPMKYQIPISVNSKVMFIDICCGHNHTLAIDISRNVYCWGDNEYGKCGQFGQKFVQQPSKLQGATNAISISCGHDHSSYLNEFSEVFSWGCGEGGLLGNGSNQNSHFPLKAIIEKVSSICCGGLHNLAISEGQVYSWGRNEGGQLGIGLQAGVNKPQKLQIAKQIIKIGCGDAHSVCLANDGIVYGWGYNEQKQLIESDEYCFCNPIQIEEGVDNIYCGSLQTYFVKGNQLCGRGNNDFNQLVNVQMNVDQMSIGQDHSLCISNNKVYGWGINKNGELGDYLGEGVKQIGNFRSQKVGCGGYHSGIIIKGTDQYISLKYKYDYTILF